MIKLSFAVVATFLVAVYAPAKCDRERPCYGRPLPVEVCERTCGADCALVSNSRGVCPCRAKGGGL